MVQFIKRRLRNWLFSTEEVELEAKRVALKQMRESANIVALARQQLAGIDLSTIGEWEVENRGSLGLLDGLNEEEQDSIMNHIHSLYSNPALQRIADYLIRTQVLYGQMEADSLQGLNFSRATINGIKLFMQQVREIEGQYQAKIKGADDDFDPHEVV